MAILAFSSPTISAMEGVHAPSFCVVGPRGGGKTSVCGHLLVEGGSAGDRELAALEQRAAALHPEEGKEERRLRAIRYTVARSAHERARADGSAEFSVRAVYIQGRYPEPPACIVDCPPMKRSFRNFCRGASLGEIPVVCFPALFSQEDVEETRDVLHTLNAFRVGKHGVLVVITKMDLVEYDLRCYKRAKRVVHQLIHEVGFSGSESALWTQPQKARVYALFMSLKRVRIGVPLDLRKILGLLVVQSSPPVGSVPVAAIANVGLVQNMDGVSSSSLLSALVQMSHLRPPPRIDLPPRFLLVNTFRILGVGMVLCGRVLQGCFKYQSEVFLGLERGPVKGIEQMHTPLERAAAGCLVSFNTMGMSKVITSYYKTRGTILGPRDLTRGVAQFTARIRQVGLSKGSRRLKVDQKLCLHVMSFRVHVQIIDEQGGCIFACKVDKTHYGIALFPGLGFVFKGGSGRIEAVGEILDVTVE